MNHQMNAEPHLPSCRYNEFVSCAPNHRHCKRCGWNPTVALDRHKAMGIYPAVQDLPVLGNNIGRVLYVYANGKVTPYCWNGHRWAIKKDDC